MMIDRNQMMGSLKIAKLSSKKTKNFYYSINDDTDLTSSPRHLTSFLALF